MNLLRANKNFLFMFLGRIITNIGDSLYYVAAMWLVYDLGGSAFYSGLAGFLILLPASFQFLVGPFVDKWAIRNTLVVTQLLQCALLLVIPITYQLDLLSVELLLLIMPLIAFIEQFSYPAQTKSLPLILGKNDLMKGNSLFSFAYQGVDLIFNAVAGILVASIGAITLYLLDSVTFAIAALFFRCINIQSQSNSTASPSKEKTVYGNLKKYFSELSEGFILVFHSLLGTFLIGSILCNFAIGVAMAVMPSYADVKGDSAIYGWLLTGLSAGSLTGALLGAWVGRFRVGAVIIIGFTIGGLCWTLSAIFSSALLSVLFFGLAWVPIGISNIIFSSAIQTILPNRLLGRVNSVTRSMSAIAMPVGSLLGGYFATLYDSRMLFSITGLGLLIISVVWIIHPGLRKLQKAMDLTASDFKIHIVEEKPDGLMQTND
jgi:MFS family permease